MFFLTVSFEGSLNTIQDMSSSQLLLVAAVINEILAAHLTMIWNCLYSLQTMKKLWWKFKSLVLFLKLQCLLLKWTLYHICHKGTESCFFNEWILINQLLFSVWISKASCWNGFHYDRVSLFLSDENVFSQVSFIISHSSFKNFSVEMNKWTSYHTSHNDMEYCFLEELQ